MTKEEREQKANENIFDFILVIVACLITKFIFGQEVNFLAAFILWWVLDVYRNTDKILKKLEEKNENKS
jgi:hypothetical protein